MKFLYWIYNLAHLLFDVNDALDSDFSGHVSLSILVIGQHFNSPPLRPVLSPPWSAIRTRKPHTAKQLLQNLYSPHCPLYYEIKGCCQNNCAIIYQVLIVWWSFEIKSNYLCFPLINSMWSVQIASKSVAPWLSLKASMMLRYFL